MSSTIASSFPLRDFTSPGTELEVEIEGRRYATSVQALPFDTRSWPSGQNSPDFSSPLYYPAIHSRLPHGWRSLPQEGASPTFEGPPYFRGIDNPSPFCK